MRQSRKEQIMERSSRSLLHSDRREAMSFSEAEDEDMEAAAEWAAGEASLPRRDLKGERGV